MSARDSQKRGELCSNCRVRTASAPSDVTSTIHRARNNLMLEFCIVRHNCCRQIVRHALARLQDGVQRVVVEHGHHLEWSKELLAARAKSSPSSSSLQAEQILLSVPRLRICRGSCDFRVPFHQTVATHPDSSIDFGYGPRFAQSFESARAPRSSRSRCVWTPSLILSRIPVLFQFSCMNKIDCAEHF